MKWWRGGLLLVLLLAGSTTVLAQDTAGDGGSIEYVIGIGDRVRISYYQGVSFEDVGKVIETDVGEEGKVLVPLLGKVQVAGLTPSEIQRNIKRDLTRYIEEPQVFVEVLDYRSLTAVLVGACVQQGVFALVPNMAASEFIAANGGIQPNADLENVSLLRSNGELIRLDLRSFFQNGVATQDILMQPGDRVFIPFKPISWLEKTSRVVQLVGLVLQTVILIAVLGG
ncbi:polysaccharide export protein [bacterium]|nr:polysaccharide export protein [bacterium]